MWSQSRHFCLCIIFLDMQCVFQTPHNGPTGHIIAQHVFFLRRLVLWSCLETLLTQSNVLILSNFGILPRVGMLPTFTIFPWSAPSFSWNTASARRWLWLCRFSSQLFDRKNRSESWKNFVRNYGWLFIVIHGQGTSPRRTSYTIQTWQNVSTIHHI